VTRFLAKLIGFISLQLAVLSLLMLDYPDTENSYAAAIIDKHELARTAPGPRILLTGGSNVAFGIDSQMIHRETGYYPVNLALSAHVGMDYMLNEVEALARPDDVIVASIEYEHFIQDITAFTSLHVLECHPPAASYFSWRQHKKLLDMGLVFLSRVARANKKPVLFYRDSFNEYGDVVSHHDEPPTYTGPDEKHEVDADYMAARIDTLNAFAQRCESRGIRVFYLHPSFADDALEEFERMGFAELRDALTDGILVPQLVSIEEAIYPKRLFYDTAYHLTLEGKQQRTRLLVNRLADQIEYQPAPPIERMAVRPSKTNL